MQHNITQAMMAAGPSSFASLAAASASTLRIAISVRTPEPSASEPG